jgi:hypothetical protein
MRCAVERNRPARLRRLPNHAPHAMPQSKTRQQDRRHALSHPQRTRAVNPDIGVAGALLRNADKDFRAVMGEPDFATELIFDAFARQRGRCLNDCLSISPLLAPQFRSLLVQALDDVVEIRCRRAGMLELRNRACHSPPATSLPPSKRAGRDGSRRASRPGMRRSKRTGHLSGCGAHAKLIDLVYEHARGSGL